MNLCSARHVTRYIWCFWEDNFSNIRLLPQNIMNWSRHKLSRRNSKIKLPPNIMTKLTLCFDINLLLILPIHVYTLPSLHFSKKTPRKKKMFPFYVKPWPGLARRTFQYLCSETNLFPSSVYRILYFLYLCIFDEAVNSWCYMASKCWMIREW